METAINFGKDFVLAFFSLFAEMAPYLLLGFALAGVLHVYFPKHKVAKYLGNKNLKSVINAALLGIPLPLCSCGVIPTGISFNTNGASKGATVSFLISTPQTGVDSMLVTYSLLGLPFALIRPIAAFLTGIFGGAITNKIDDTPAHDFTAEPENPITGNRLKKAFQYAFVDFLQDIAKWLMVGLLIAALFTVLIPNNFIENHLNYPFLNMLLVLVASIPLYVCATGSVPIAAVLMMKGLSPGAAFVFLMAGPATNAATMTVIKQAMGAKTLYAYLASIITGALIIGLLINQFPPNWFILPGMGDLAHNHSEMGLQWYHYLSAFFLAGFLLNGMRLKYFPSRKKIEKMNSTDKIIKIEGMTCNHCKATVEKNLSQFEFVESVQVDLNSKTARVAGGEIDLKKVQDKIEDLGFTYQGEE